MGKKKAVAILAMLLALAVGCGSTPPEPPAPTPAPFTGTVVAVEEDSLLVMPDEESWVAHSADRVAIATKDVPLSEKNGNPLIMDDLCVGDIITVYPADNTLRESDPAQLDARSIERVESPGVETLGGSVAVPAQQYDSPDFIDTAYFALHNLPDRDGLRPMEYWLYDHGEAAGINRRYVADVWYEADICPEMHLRAAWEGEVAPLHEYEATVTEHRFTTEMGHDTTVTVEASSHNVLAVWDAGFSFALWMPNCTVEEALPVIEEIVTQVLVAVT